MFGSLFIAEQFTLVAVFIMIETQYNPTSQKSSNRWSIGSRNTCSLITAGFRVNYITSLSVLALIESQKVQGIDEDIQVIIDRGIEWLSIHTKSGRGLS